MKKIKTKQIPVSESGNEVNAGIGVNGNIFPVGTDNVENIDDETVVYSYEEFLDMIAEFVPLCVLEKYVNSKKPRPRTKFNFPPIIEENPWVDKNPYPSTERYFLTDDNLPDYLITCEGEK